MGCLGNGSTMDVSVPTKIDVQGKKLKAISMGKRHAVSITEDGEVFSWGKGEPIGNFNTYRRMVISLQCFTLNRVIFVEYLLLREDWVMVVIQIKSLLNKLEKNIFQMNQSKQVAIIIPHLCCQKMEIFTCLVEMNAFNLFESIFSHHKGFRKHRKFDWWRSIRRSLHSNSFGSKRFRRKRNQI
jgi:hypothetical protein